MSLIGPAIIAVGDGATKSPTNGKLTASQSMDSVHTVGHDDEVGYTHLSRCGNNGDALVTFAATMNHLAAPCTYAVDIAVIVIDRRCDVDTFEPTSMHLQCAITYHVYTPAAIIKDMLAVSIECIPCLLGNLRE